MTPSFQIPAAKRDLPLVDSLLARNKAPKVQTDISHSVVAVCPNSKTVLKVFLRSAKGCKALIKFAAMEGVFIGSN